MVQPDQEAASGQSAVAYPHWQRYYPDTAEGAETEVGLMATLVTAAPAETKTTAGSFQRYYEEAGPDYAAWSAPFNMHFGFFRWGMNPFQREAMLEQMNLEVLDRLHLNPEPSACSPARILDMGCGLGATLRSFARRLRGADLNGITLVPWQLEQGQRLNQSR